MTYQELQDSLLAYGRSLSLSGLQGRSISGLLTNILFRGASRDSCLVSAILATCPAGSLPPILGGPTAPDLGAAESFGILASSTVTNTGGSVITGDLGLSPGTSVTGFPPGIVIGTQHITDTQAALAQLAAMAAYNDLAGRPGGISVAGNIGGQTLFAGVYKSTSSLSISSGDLTLDAQGDPNAVFIFQIASTLVTTVGRQVILINGAQAGNVFWQVGSSATLGTTSVMKGTIIALASDVLTTGASLEGRAWALTGAVTLDTNAVTVPVLAPETTVPGSPSYIALQNALIALAISLGVAPSYVVGASISIILKKILMAAGLTTSCCNTHTACDEALFVALQTGCV